MKCVSHAVSEGAGGVLFSFGGRLVASGLDGALRRVRRRLLPASRRRA